MKKALSNLMFLLIWFLLGYTFSMVNVYSLVKKINFEDVNISLSGVNADLLKEMVVFSWWTIQIDQHKWQQWLSGQKQQIVDQLKEQLKEYLMNQLNSLISK